MLCFISAVFLLWGSLRFLKIPVRQTLFGLFMLFLMAWTFIGPHIISESLGTQARILEMQLPVFILLGLSSVFAGVCFFRLRKKMPFVGAGMLAMGFFLWGLYLGSYPLSQQDEHLSSAGFFVAAVLQLFIAVSMIVLGSGGDPICTRTNQCRNPGGALRKGNLAGQGSHHRGAMPLPL